MNQMNQERDRIARRLRLAAVAAAALVALVGVLVLVAGWWFDVEWIRQPFADYPAMRAATALGLVAGGIGVSAHGLGWSALLTAGTGLVDALIGAAVAGSYLLGLPKAPLEWGPALDQARDSAVSGRVAVNTAVCLLLVGVGQILLSLRRADGWRQSLGMGAALIAYVAVLGYGTSGFAVAGGFSANYTAMAAHTAVPMLLIGFALMFVSLDRGWGRIFTEPLAGGRVARRLLPVVMIVFVVAAGLYSLAVPVEHDVLGDTLLIAGLAVVMSVGLLVVAERMQRIDTERESLATDIESRIADRTLDIRQATTLLRAQFDGSPNGVALVGLAGKCLDANAALCAMTGRSHVELIGTDLGQLFTGPDRGRFSELTNAVSAGRSWPPSASVRLQHPLGKDVVLRVSMAIAGDENAEPLVRVYTFENITEQEHAVRELARSEERYRLVADNATDAVLLVDMDNHVKWASPSVRTVLGLDPDLIRGVDATTLIQPLDLPQLAAARARAAAGEGGVDVELRLLTADRGFRWMAGTIAPAVDANGSIVGRVTTFKDVDDQVRARTALERSEQLFRLAMDGAPQGMALMDLSGRFNQVNASLCRMLGRNEGWLRAHTATDVIHPDDQSQFGQELSDLLGERSQGVTRERRWLRGDGSILWVVESTGLLRGDSDKPLFLVLHVQDNSVAHRVRAELAHRANHDQLTGLLNADQLRQHLNRLLALPATDGMTPALLFCDIDHFKDVNDLYGHAVGDEVLRITASRIASVLRQADVVARQGGDEFVVALAGVPDAAAAASVAEKIRAAIREPMPAGSGDGMAVTISVGVALASTDTAAHRWLRRADAALYQAKHAGRDRIAVLDDASTAHFEKDIRDSLDAGRFVPWFQPIVRLSDGEVVGFEALARRLGQGRQILAPDEFLPEAERTGLIVRLDLAILRRSVEWISRVGAPVHVSVNVSGRTLESRGYARAVTDVIAAAQVDPGRIHLELTETVLLRSKDSVRQAMAELADAGVRWFIDDFGTGYSSIAHLRDLPIAGLKLDRSFTADLGASDSRGRQLARALAALASNLGLDSVAEGVEAREQAQVLADQGWQYGQGMLFGKPTALSMTTSG